MRLINNDIERIVGLRVENAVQCAVRIPVTTAVRIAVSFNVRAGDLRDEFQYDISDTPLRELPFCATRQQVDWGVRL